MLTPERSIEIQGLLGADIQMQLDECVKPAGRARTPSRRRCACRCAGPSAAASPSASSPGKALFGIVQGGTVARLRVESAQALVALDFKGYAIGGLAVGEPQDDDAGDASRRSRRICRPRSRAT